MLFRQLFLSCSQALLCTGDRKIEKKSKKKKENKEKGRKYRKKKRKKWENCRDLVLFLCNSIFSVLIYTIQTTLFVMQLGSVVHWRTIEGPTPATALRRWFRYWIKFFLTFSFSPNDFLNVFCSGNPASVVCPGKVDFL